MTPAPDTVASQSRLARALAGAVSGVLAAAVAVGVAQFASGLGVPQSSPVVAVGEAAIDLAPPPVKDFAITTFGSHDKTALLGGILVILALYAAVVGMLAGRRLAFGLAGLAAFAALGLAAALTRPGATAGFVVPTLAGAAAGTVTLSWLTRAAARLAAPPARSAPARPAPAAPPSRLVAPDLADLPPDPFPVLRAGPGSAALDKAEDRSRWPARRSFIISSGAAAGLAALGTAAGRNLTDEHNVAAARSAIRFPRPSVAAPPLPPGSNLNIAGLSSFVTPDASFYRVDTALLVPQVNPASWQLRIHGMVQREVTVNFADLLRLPLREAWVTLTCVSDPVGGPYVGNAKWLGASLADLIRRAHPLAGADQLLSTSVDGYTSGTPLAVVLDGRNALLAVAMNGQALPLVHGFPARMVVPGLYGYVSATKWVVDLEVTTFATARAFWAQRGWSQQGPIKTEARIDVPGDGAALAPGRTAVAGVAWAQHKGIAAVEVRVNGGPWYEARLAAVPGIDTWRQWVWEWQAAPGNYLIEARATDETGYTQTSVQAQPPPNGASGYPSAQVAVGSS
jgi:DMSO/TMAO reductase YedYZ molybdopterin-dependent catalytic subunit